MSNERIHPQLTIDRKSIVFVYTGRANIVYEGMPIPEDLQDKEYIFIPRNIPSISTTAISVRIKVLDDGSRKTVRDPAVYDSAFLQELLHPGSTELDRLTLLEEQYGSYRKKKTGEAFLGYMDQLIANANSLLGGKMDIPALWQSPEGRLLLDWMHQQKGYLAQPVAPRRAKSRAQLLDTKTQLAVIYYLRKGGEWQGSLLPSKELAYFLAGLTGRTANSIEPLLPYLTENPGGDQNEVLTEKHISKAKNFFLDTGSPHLAKLANEDLIHLK